MSTQSSTATTAAPRAVDLPKYIRLIWHGPVMSTTTPPEVMEMLRLMRRGAQLNEQERDVVRSYISPSFRHDFWTEKWDGTDPTKVPCPHGECRPFAKGDVERIESERGKLPSLIIKPNTGIVSARRQRSSTRRRP